MVIKKQIVIKWLIAMVWIAIGSGVVVLLVAAMQQEDKQKCTGTAINIKGAASNFFVDKNDILIAINQFIDGEPKGQLIASFNLRAMETDLQKNIWVKKVQMFFDNNAVLQVNVLEREPIARVFGINNSTFYIDSSLMLLPLSERLSARLPVFTGFPSDKKVLIKEDSVLLKNVAAISTAIQKDSFLIAMIDQIDITPRRTFEMIPKIGNSIIVFGDATNIAEKFARLQIFYKEVMIKTGWDYYSKIDVQYNNQIVAKRKGAEDVTADSLRTENLMKLMAYNMELQASDSLQAIAQDNEHNSTNIALIEQSIQRDDNFSATSEKLLPQGIPVIAISKKTNPGPMKLPEAKHKPMVTVAKKTTAPTKKPVLLKKVTTAVPKPAMTTKPAAVKKPLPTKPAVAKPKATMPPKPLVKKVGNDY
jgi:cell division protein FtsQ